MMRSFLIRGGVAIIVLVVLWLFTARSISLLIDQAFAVPLASLPASPIGWNGAYLQFGSSPDGVDGPKGGWNGGALQTGSHVLDLEGPGPGYRQAATLGVDAHDRLVIAAGGDSLVLGSRAGVLSGGDGPVPAFAAEPGDTASLALERSWLSWPVFEFNFMTGQSPSWRRHLYYHLSWTKRSGARLDMLWRFEQGFYASDGWAAPGARDGATGLIRATIRPAPATRPGG
jgi:hypothetical protein